MTRLTVENYQDRESLLCVYVEPLASDYWIAPGQKLTFEATTALTGAVSSRDVSQPALPEVNSARELQVRQHPLMNRRGPTVASCRGHARQHPS